MFWHELGAHASGVKKSGGFLVIRATPLPSRVVAISDKALKAGVVDQFGKVYGVEGLRVVDASIMPDTVRANLNVTVLAMAEHVADFIKEGR